MTQDPIVCSVVKLLQERSERGMRKYKTTLAREDLSMRDWIEHARDEMLDGALYLERMRSEYDAKILGLERAKTVLAEVADALRICQRQASFPPDYIQWLIDGAAKALGQETSDG